MQPSRPVPQKLRCPGVHIEQIYIKLHKPTNVYWAAFYPCEEQAHFQMVYLVATCVLLPLLKYS